MTAGFGVVIALAIIQGFTEFLPISSSGHLVIVESLFKMRGLSIGSNILFDTVVHLGTLAAGIIFYRRKVLLL
ncbi:MAG TPA: undecaprenyl-diphosphate phosphatase, partial [Candidatus Bathyarchaeia archaeon]|nr:undecaprenyl-diphosphate phosphatase [Candidatus Bathyarchaeia archaeon]